MYFDIRHRGETSEDETVARVTGHTRVGPPGCKSYDVSLNSHVSGLVLHPEINPNLMIELLGHF